MGIFPTPALSVIRDTVARTKIFAINDTVIFSCKRIAESREQRGKGEVDGWGAQEDAGTVLFANGSCILPGYIVNPLVR